MDKVQITHVQLDNYGPWTVTPEPKPEGYLQALQARIFADIEDEFSMRGGIIFPTRFDNMLAVSNGISFEGHRMIQEKVHENYPLTISIGIGVSEKAYEAQKLASSVLQEAGSSRSPNRREVLAGKTLSSIKEGRVQIAHFDVDHSTYMTDNEPVYGTHRFIQCVHLVLISSLSRFGALVFYMGGDNFMAISNGLDKGDFSLVIEEIERKLDAELKVGVGVGRTGKRAASLASEALQDIRKEGIDSRIALKGQKNEV